MFPCMRETCLSSAGTCRHAFLLDMRCNLVIRVSLCYTDIFRVWGVALPFGGVFRLGILHLGFLALSLLRLRALRLVLWGLICLIQDR